MRLRPLHVGLLIPWVVAVVAARRPIADNSFLWHVRAGSLQLETGEVLTREPFSFTFAGTPWRTQSWLLELAYGWLDGLFGLGFAPWLIGGVSLTVLGSIVLVAHRLAGSVAIAVFFGAAGGWLGAAYLNPRPVIASYLFLTLIVGACLDDRLRWIFPLVAWLWAGVHASFVIGIAYVVLDGLRTGGLRKRAVDAAMMLPPLLLTAHGAGVVTFLVDFVDTREALAYLTEWATPELISIQFALVLPSIVLLMIGMNRQVLTMRDLWLVVPVLTFMVSASRSVFPAWLMLLPVLAKSAEPSRPLGGSKVPTSRIDRVLVPTFAVAVLMLPFLPSMHSALDPERFPLRAHQVLTAERVYADDVAGGFLIYESWPQRRVFVDDRAEVYGDDFFRDVIDTRAGTPTWRRVFDEWQIEEAVVHRTDGLAGALAGAGWNQVWSDPEFLVFGRP